MSHSRSGPGIEPPVVSAPPRFVERRASFRRAEDRLAHRETVLLARSLDVLTAGGDAEARLAGILHLLASTVGARRGAVLAGGPERQIAVAVAEEGERADGESLAAWLDAWAPRPRTVRAASGPASISVVIAPPGKPLTTRASGDPNVHHFACLPIPSAGDVALGFDFSNEGAAAELEQRLPPQLARHAAVALALVTEQAAAERELAGLRGREMEQSRYVSTVAHELRTPLTGLKGYLELILGDQVDDPADRRDFLERSRQIVETMGELVSDLLELSRLESATLRLEQAPFSPAEVCRRVIAQLAPIAVVSDVELRSDLPPRLSSATGDRRRVEQILTNLTGNALKFAPAGSVIELDARFDGPVAVVVVRDEGAGIGPEDRTRIFERFYRMAGHDRVTGTGLGLPIARDLARAMGGDLDVASVPGSGSAFVLVLQGPTGADGAAVEAALREAAAEEEMRLEERAVLRAIEGRGSRRRGPRLVHPSGAGSVDQHRRPILRAISGRQTSGDASA